MKKLLLSFVLISVVLGANAQGVIPNGTFETWGPQNAGTREPTSWTTTNPSINQALSSADRGNVLKEQVFYHTIATSAVLIDSTYPVLGVVPGTMAVGASTFAFVAGPPASLKINPGLAFPNRPDSVEFWYAYIPQGTDSMSVSVVLSRWNTALLKRDTVGWVAIKKGGFVNPNGVWAKVTDTIRYVAYGLPDSLTLIVQSSPYPGGTANTKLYFDDIAFRGIDSTKAPSTIGVNNRELNSSLISLFPNPAKQFVDVNYHGSPGSRLVVNNMLGQRLLDLKLTGVKMRFDVSGYEDGLYIFQVIDPQGAPQSTGRFVVSK